MVVDKLWCGATSLGFTSLSVVGVRLSGRHDNSCPHPAGSTQRDLYEACAAQLVDRFLGGANACLLAYGQTASGKTFTAGTDGELARLPRKSYTHSAISISCGENLPIRRWQTSMSALALRLCSAADVAACLAGTATSESDRSMVASHKDGSFPCAFKMAKVIESRWVHAIDHCRFLSAGVIGQGLDRTGLLPRILDAVFDRLGAQQRQRHRRLSEPASPRFEVLFHPSPASVRWKTPGD